MSIIEISFDFRSDTPPGKDPDTYSPTLRKYHKILWSKPLPNGKLFDLSDTTPGIYLYHKSEVGEFFLASDAVIPAFPYVADISDKIPVDVIESFNTKGYTIGGMMLFPGNQIGRKMTINSARGFHPRIKDRFDLTIECIRRLYSNEDSPLLSTLERYADFFGLFKDFRGYVEFFLLQDMVTEDFSAVRFSAPFDDFQSSPVPKTVEAYMSYRQLSIEFIEARNRRILEYS